MYEGDTAQDGRRVKRIPLRRAPPEREQLHHAAPRGLAAVDEECFQRGSLEERRRERVRRRDDSVAGGVRGGSHTADHEGLALAFLRRPPFR